MAQNTDRPSTTRAASTSSTLSCITVRNDRQSISSVASASTPPTSSAESGSVSSKGTMESGNDSTGGPREGRVRASEAGQNENVLSSHAKRGSRAKAAEGSSRAISGETLVGTREESQRQLVHDSVQLLNLDWEVEGMLGDDIQRVTNEDTGLKRRRSTRLGILGGASRILEKTKSVLGKRGREAAEAGKERLQNLQRRASLRPREPEKSSFDAPVKKKARLSEPMDIPRKPQSTEAKTEPVARSKIKRWLSQGLYVGQDRDFDPRFTETKNKLKKATRQQPEARQRSLLPLPMFAGERTLHLGRNFRLPFDVFSPLPPGQPKPEEWKKTQKNVFVGDAGQIWKKSKPLAISICSCASEKGCDEGCHNRIMYYECDDQNCSLGPERCGNRSFYDLAQRCKSGGKYNIGVEVMRTKDRGYGLRSNRTFEPHQIIVEYAGEIITQDECDSRMMTRYKDAECYYLMAFDQNMIIDATRGSVARFINHSCEPNCKIIKWTVAGKPRMALFAGDKGIMTGEELTYDYNFDPFSSKNIQECRCGAPSCRGVLGPKAKDQPPNAREIKDALKPIVTGGKRKFQEAIEDSLQAVTKKRKIAVPSSIKSAITAVKTQANDTVRKAKEFNPSEAFLGKDVSKVAPRNIRRSSLTQTRGNRTEKRTTITYVRPRSSIGASTRSPKTDQTPVNGKSRAKEAAASLRKNVVRTVRRSGRMIPNGVDKTIRVIGDVGE